MSSALTQTLYLCLAVLLSGLWIIIPGATRYNLQFVAIIDLLYFVSRILFPRLYRFTRPPAPRSYGEVGNIISAMVFISITLILISSTGSLISPLFFLLQFLLFFLALLFQPIAVAITTAMTIISLIISNHQPLNITSSINLLSLSLITPVAILFGQKFLLAIRSQKEIKSLNQEIAYEETNTLIWLTTVAKTQMVVSLDLIAQVIGANKLPAHLQEKLMSGYREILTMYRSADTLKSDLSSETQKPAAEK
ncbi:hypothetical protein A2368_04090 [Candidatus Collierbacteria bacterium RIFOXYB1_FULL_49_13]|uniref:Uncharacterized protein n=1 Tax=Candidatus Collierbacteria bacterium RIFOXYB1_FULL_49_13 TaxID=1817728 RepID=A0A1F5FHZ0_9BACT|nr:MAG: hypothetical protein A2368_04090 [Candidatus Collierbacteria bacterium RIFOXYB1_FULL_49_13]